MRRHAGCDERDGGLVDGRQGHDPGSTIGAAGLRPLYKSPAVIRMTRSLRGRILLTVGLPLGGRQAGVFHGSSLCGVGQSATPDVTSRMCRGIRFVWFTVMSPRI
jgi:hypothetical protein